MKTLKQQTKTTLLLMALIVSVTIYGQNDNKNKQMFVRIYNLEGKKINKGKVIAVTDSTLQLNRMKGVERINLKDIGMVKTKRSAGNNVLMGSAIGATSMAILGAASADPDAWIFSYSAGEGAAAGAFLGGTAGAAIGGITILFKNSKTFLINGDIEKWKAFQEMISKH
jgi:outer membrane lipoprotein SlyB